MSDPLRPTAEEVFLIDVEVEKPANGSRVFALGLGGTLVPVVWSTSSHLYFWAWMKSPTVPTSVKERMSAHWGRPRVNAVNKE